MVHISRSFGAVAALTLIGVGFSVMPASALSDRDCGSVDWPLSMTANGSTCELRFPEAGDYSWTIPDGASDMYAMLVAGGGGAKVDVFAPTPLGYAGNGGEVTFADLTSATSGSTIDITVGAGGASGPSSPTAGGDSIVTIGGVDTTAEGGEPGNSSSPAFGTCNPGFSGTYGEGVGAGIAGTPPSGEACTGGQPGINPSTDGSTPAVFTDVDVEYGHGGGISDDGSDIVYTWGTGGSMSGSNSYGDGLHGYVIIRFTMSATSGSGSSDKLAETGNTIPVAPLALGSMVAIAVGTVASAARFSRRTR